MLGPNITGSHLSNTENKSVETDKSCEGAFYPIRIKGGFNSASADDLKWIGFDASRSNQLYKGSVFQPKSLMALAIVKI